MKAAWIFNPALLLIDVGSWWNMLQVVVVGDPDEADSALEQARYAMPLVILLVTLFSGYTPYLAAFTGITLCVLVGLLNPKRRMRPSEIREFLKLIGRPGIVSFAGGIPDPALFPGSEIGAAYQRQLTDPALTGQALQYSISEGGGNH